MRILRFIFAFEDAKNRLGWRVATVENHKIRFVRFDSRGLISEKSGRIFNGYFFIAFEMKRAIPP